MKKSLPIYPLLIVLGLVLLCVYIWLSTKPANLSPPNHRGHHSQSFLVKVAKPVIKPMPLTLDEVGTVGAGATVNIIPQVTGVLKKIDFQPGENVKEGQLLFELDPSVYTASLDQANANLLRDQAQLATLQATADRYQALAKLEYVTRQQAEESQAQAKAQAALVAADTALVQQAQIQLGYTKIHAPIAGKTGNVSVNIGDLITANSAPLLVINQMDPVSISFNVSQSRLTDILRFQRAGSLRVNILPEGSEQVITHGTLSFIDNNVNNQTGTVLAKANAPNPDSALWPGQLVTVELILTVQPRALVIPDSAVQIGQQGNYVYVVKNNKAAVQAIALSQQINHEAVISQGLRGDETVIIEIPPGLSEGSTVHIEKQSQEQP